MVNPARHISGGQKAVRSGIVALALVAGLATAAVRAATVDEYRVKAVFLFHFAQFVEWPVAAAAAPGAPVVVGILGEDPFGPVLDEILQGETVGSRPFEVRRLGGPAEAPDCHILFISRSESGRLERVLADLRGRPVLTVGDADGYAQRGVMIRFVTERGRIRFRINTRAAQAAGLEISSKLLRPAEIVGGGGS